MLSGVHDESPLRTCLDGAAEMDELNRRAITARNDKNECGMMANVSDSAVGQWMNAEVQ